MIGTRRSLAYIAGAYRAPTRIGIYRNIHAAARVAAEVANRGFAVICPHTNSRLVELFARLGDEYWLDADLEILRRCDLVVLVGGWRASAGTVAEVELARSLGIPVYELDDLPEVSA